MSRHLRKPAFANVKNKDADHLHGNCEANQCFCFCYNYSTIPLLPKSEISSLKPSSAVVQPSLSDLVGNSRQVLTQRLLT